MRREDCISGGGEAGELIRAIDWARTPLGPTAEWPESLCTVVSVMLASHVPISIVWGKEHILLYNDAYRPILGASKHPSAMGSPTDEAFREAWSVIGPLFERVFAGDTVALTDLRVLLERNGYTEECYFTFSTSPIRSGETVGGALGVVSETTARVLAERRLRSLRELAGSLAHVETTRQVCTGAAAALARSQADLPFALFYLVDAERRVARLAAHVGLPGGSPALVAELALDGTESGWPLARVAAGAPVIVDDLERRFGELRGPLHPEPVRSAAILPLARFGGLSLLGFLVAGVNPRRALDAEYLDFFRLTAEHLAAALNNAASFDEQRRVGEELALRERRMRSFLLEAPAAIAVLRGPRLIFELANERYYQIVGRRDIVGKPGREALPELVGQGVWDLLDRVYATGEPFVGDDFPARFDRKGDGALDERIFNWIGQPAHDPAGRVDGVMFFAVDVTEQARARRQLEESRAVEQQLRHEAEEANRSKDEFLAMLGHELRNPLAPIATALHLMKLRAGDVVAKERVIIERQVEHLTRLVDDLLDVSRITRGKIELNRQRLEMASVVAGAIEIASPLFELRRHHLAVDVPARGLAVDGDPLRLAQVVSNLLTNAAKYTEPGGRIAVTCAREGGELVLRVRDNGLGIAPPMLPRVFDLFVQERQSIDRARGGLGLGLAIVRTLVTMHGGSVSVFSEGHGRGSEFTIRLPTASASPDSRGARRAEAPRLKPGGQRILVVDDNVDAAALLAGTLELLGHDTRVAHDGPSALDLVETFRPELAVLDIGLPVMDGYELARRLRQVPALGDLRLIALTGYGQQSDRDRSRAAGFDVHLVKPVQIPLLEAFINGAD